jgi:predicted heme/steroid binding protein/uncharacterized membrane protein
MKEMDPKDLSQHRGGNGNSVYVAHQGKVFDVSKSPLWKGGVHMARHRGGADLTTDIQAAPHGPEVLERYPQVGTLKVQEAHGRPIPGALTRLFAHFPMLRRHPHPMTVHFPIAFSVATAAFTVLYLLTGIEGFDFTAAACLGACLICTPVAMGTGYATWWLNYMAKPLKPVAIKRRCSAILFTLEIVTFAWRMVTPDILNPLRPASWVYLLFIGALVPLVTVIGWFGASLTFPMNRE